MTDKDLIYKKIGMIMHIAQNLEYNLSTIIAFKKIEVELSKRRLSNDEIKDKINEIEILYDEISRKPLGFSMELAKETNIFTEDFLNTLIKALHSRNYYAHKFFKDDLKKNMLNTNAHKLNEELALAWLEKGAKPSDTVKSILSKEGIIKEFTDKKLSK